MFIRKLLSIESKFQVFRSFSKVNIKPCPRTLPINVTIIGANSNSGRLTAMLLKARQTVRSVFLHDNSDLTQLVSDLCTINTRTNVVGFTGIQNLRDSLLDARIIFISTGLQKTPEDDEERLFERNAFEVRQILMYCAEFNPNAMLIIASPPVCCFVPMAIEEYKKADQIGGKRIFGLVRTYVSRANSICGQHLNTPANSVNCYIVGGSHRRCCIPVLSQLQNAGSINRKTNEVLTRLIQEAEEDVLYEKQVDKKTQGCYLITAYSGYKFIESLASAMMGAKDVMECAYVQQDAPMDEYTKYFTTIVQLGPDGVISSKVPKLSKLEMTRVNYIIEELRNLIYLGESYVTGEDRNLNIHRPKKLPKPPEICEREKEDKKATAAETCEKREPLKQTTVPKKPDPCETDEPIKQKIKA